MHENIVYAQTIFCPDDVRFNKNYESIKSFIEYFELKPIDMYLGGYCLRDEYFDKLKDLVKDIPNCNIQRFERNYGKAYCIDALIKDALSRKSYEYILTADSDIKFDKQETNLLPRLVGCVSKVTEMKKMKFGVVGLNQKERNLNEICALQQHIWTYKNSFDQEEKILWHDWPGYIAGGCLFTAVEAWTKVGGYRIMGVYAGDEAYYLIDLRDNGFTWQLIDSLAVIHPEENDLDYLRWKNHICRRDMAGTIKKDLMPWVDEAEEFWKNR